MTCAEQGRGPDGTPVPQKFRAALDDQAELVYGELAAGGFVNLIHFRVLRPAHAISKSRLYGWLMPAYSDPGSSLLQQHLPHRDPGELAEAARRLGWASWEDCHTVVPGACPWLTPTPSAQ